MNCDPYVLMHEASCFRCIPHNWQNEIAIYLLCQWANAGGCDLPAKATNPLPASGNDHVGALGIALGDGPTLSWNAVPGATSYDVSFNGGAPVNQPGTTFTPPTLAYSTPYTWRVDPINACGKTTGDDWTFTTAPEFAWAPGNFTVTWMEGGAGPFNGTLAFFQANANYRLVTEVDGSVSSKTSLVGIQSLPALTTLLFEDNLLVGTIDARDCPQLLTINLSFNNLTAILTEGCSALQRLEFQQNFILATVSGLNPAPVSLVYVEGGLCALNHAVQITCVHLQRLSLFGNITIPLITLNNVVDTDNSTGSGDIILTHSGPFASLSFPHLQTYNGMLNSLDVDVNASMTSFLVPLLSSCTILGINAGQCALTGTQTFIALTIGLGIRLAFNPLLNTVSCPSINFTGAGAGAFILANNCGLNVGSVDFFLRQAVVSGFDGGVPDTVYLDGGTNAHPTDPGQGINDYNTLALAGVDVAINP